MVQIRGSIEEPTGLSAIAVRQALATAEDVYGHTSRIGDPALGGIIVNRIKRKGPVRKLTGPFK